MTIKDAIPVLQRTLKALKAMPENIEIVSVDTHLYLSDTSISIHVANEGDIKQLARSYGRCVRRTVEDPNENGEIWTWLRFSSPDDFLRFVTCNCKKAAPSDATTGDGTA